MLTIVVVALARQIGTLHLRLGPRGALEIDVEGPPLGEAPEPIELSTGDGATVSIGRPGAPQLVLFVSPDCPACRDVLPSVGTAARSGGLSPIVVIEDGPEGQLGVRAAAPVARSGDAFHAYNVPGTPFAVVLDAMGV